MSLLIHEYRFLKKFRIRKKYPEIEQKS